MKISSCDGFSGNLRRRKSLILMFLAFLLTFFKFSDSSTPSRSLIINGYNADPTEYQFFLRSWPDSVRDTNDVLCGASLIHSDIILTAAHCQGGFNYGAMAYDPSTGQFNRYRKVDLQIAYPRYYENPKVINYDLMILRLASSINDIQPVTINDDPDFPMDKNNGISGDSSLLECLGVGITEDGVVSRGLKLGHFAPITNDDCFSRLQIANVNLTEDILCVDPSNDESICAGDSGGPLTAAISNNNNQIHIQVGVVSFGNECQTDWVPDGFARVSYFSDWIKKQICKYSKEPPADCFDFYQSDEYNKFIAEHHTSEFIPFDKARTTLSFQHDFLAEQTVFSIRNLLKNKIEYVGPQYVPRRGGVHSSTFLLPVPGNYSIEIYDNGMDGLKNPDYVNINFPTGSWVISAKYRNGGRLNKLATGDSNFDAFQTKQFFLPKNVQTLITDQPSLSPTELTPNFSSNPSVVPVSFLVSSSIEPTIEDRNYSAGLAPGRVDAESSDVTLDENLIVNTSSSPSSIVAVQSVFSTNLSTVFNLHVVLTFMSSFVISLENMDIGL